MPVKQIKTLKKQRKMQDIKGRQLLIGVIAVLAISTAIAFMQRKNSVEVSLNQSTATGGPAQSKASSLPDKAKLSDVVVVATAVSVPATMETNSYGDKLIVSHVNLAVNEWLKGTTSASVKLDMVGGTLNGQTLTVDEFGGLGVPEVMKPGERAVIFLRSVNGAYEIVEGKTGLIKLQKDGRTEDNLDLNLGQIRAAIGGAR
jgi:hypothetical protein